MMKRDEVPQDNASTYANNFKAIYAVNEDGRYVVVPSSGWDVEAEATLQALQELERQTKDAYRQAQEGKRSPLFFHMYNQRMDLQVLSETSATSKWRIKRHFRPEVFRKLPPGTYRRYADALGISVDDLKTLPEQRT